MSQHRPIRRPRAAVLSLCLAAALLAGCSGVDPKSNFSLPTVPFLASAAGAARAESKATLVVSAAIADIILRTFVTASGPNSDAARPTLPDHCGPGGKLGCID